MKDLLVIASLDDIRNVRYAKAIRDIGTFNSIFKPWSEIVLNNNAEIQENYDAVRVMSPWYERKLRPILKGNDGTRSHHEQEKFLEFYVNKLKQVLDDRKVINGLDSIVVMRNKRKTQEKLSDVGVSTPRTYEILDLSDVIDALDTSEELFVKPDNASLGEGIGIIGSDEEGLWYMSNQGGDSTLSRGNIAEDIIGNLISGKGHMFQERIQPHTYKGKEYDVRAIFCIDEVIMAYARLSKNGIVGTNISQGAEASLNPLKALPRSKMDLMYYQLDEISKSLGYEIFAADIMFNSDTDPIFLELNAFPGIKGPNKFCVDIYKPEVMKLNEKLQ